MNEPYKTWLAYAGAVHIISNILYYIATRFVSTPFNDSLTEDQKEIKKESTKTRLYIYLISVAMVMIALFAYHYHNRKNATESVTEESV